MRARPLLVLTMVAAAGTPVAADVTRHDAERLASEGRAGHDPAKLVACGKAFVDLYNLDPAGADADELLASAAACYEDGQSVSAALVLYDRVRTAWPRSSHAPAATWQGAQIYARIGMLDRAADRFEDYATRWSAEPHALDALVQASELRAAIGDDIRQIADVRKLQALFGATHPREAAAALASLAPAYERQGSEPLVKHLRDYLRVHATTGGPEDTLRARAKLGAVLWQTSCPVPLVDGLCLKLDRARPVAAKPRHCGPSNPTSYTVVARDGERVKQAVAELTSVATAAWPADAETQRAVAAAQLALADQALETYLAVRFPTGLDFTPDHQRARKASLERFSAYVQRKQQLGASLTDRYTAVLVRKLAAPTVEALARVALVSQAMAEDLAGAEIPKDVRSGDFATEKITAFCDQLTAVAEPLRTRALDAYDQCLVRASQLGIADAAARRCEREHGRLAPGPFASTRELQAAPVAAWPIVDEPAVAAGKSWPRPLVDALAKLPPGGQPPGKAVCQGVLAQLTELEAKQPAARIDARYLLGVVSARCGLLAEAKRAYERVLELQPAHPAATSNLGALAWRAGSYDAAKLHWQAALASDGKLFAARLDLASAGLRELAAMPARDPKRRALEDDTRYQASNAAAVAPGDPRPFVVLALLGAGSADPRQRTLAAYFAGRARALDDSSPYVQLARGLTDPAVALDAFQRAAAGGPALDEAHLDLGLTYLNVRRYDDASTELARVSSARYDVLVARGIAARGLGKLAEAEARYGEAIALDPARPEAHFDLGVLWKEHTAARATAPAAAKLAYRKAADAFRRANTPDALQLAAACDQALAALAP